jgi:hypothetical protein
MDLKLMRDFEELEGLADQPEQVVVEDDEDDSTFKPQQASALSNAEMYSEVSYCDILILI